jgi:single-stranded-DNA-specific exonuclease
VTSIRPIDSLRIRRRTVDPAAVEALPADLHPAMRRVLAARGVLPEQLETPLSALLPVSGLGPALAAAERLLEARQRDESIVIVGDFDADGATATALMVSGLRLLGCRKVDFLVPDRFRLGYGLSPGLAEQAAAGGAQLLVTVDNGVASLDGVARASELGMQVIVTDHHLPGDELPDAAVMVNPNLPGEPFAGKGLAGVGVAFYVLAALGRLLRTRGELAADVVRTAVNAQLDLVALGTVADLVPLDYNNRILVAAGLRRIRAGHARPGLVALIDVAGRTPERMRSSDLGFAIGPRLNAAGRLADMRVGINCLLSPTLDAARPLARQLDALNQQRRQLQAGMEQTARTHVQNALARMNDAGNAYCLFDPGWHEGIVGLVASRMKDQLHRPVVAFAPAEQSGELKGSARSVRGIHIRDLLARIAARRPGLIQRFGGHAMAAGLSLRADDLDEFRAALAAESAAYAALLAEPNLLWSDGQLAAAVLDTELASALEAGGPWGQAFPEPVFDDRLEVIDWRVLKERHLKMTLRPAGSGDSIDAIAFNQVELPRGDAPRFAYRLEINDFRQQRRPQLVVECIQPTGG